MPNKYTYEKMNAGEVSDKMRMANLSVSDMVKLTGQHFMQIKQYMEQEGDPRPNQSVALILDYLSEYPEATPIMLDMAEVRIMGQGKIEERLKARFGSAYIPPEKRR